MKKVLLSFALMVGISFFAAAQSTPKVMNSQLRQTARIEHGVANGELTRHEAKSLIRQQRHIRNEKQQARADGIVTKKELAHFRQDQRVTNRAIYRQKHDVQKRH